MESKYFNQEERLLTVIEIARFLNVSTAVIYKWTYFKGMPRIIMSVNNRIRFKQSEVEAWLKGKGLITG